MAVVVFIVALSVLLGFVAWQKLGPYKISTVEVPIRVLNKEIKQGEPVTLLLTTCAPDNTHVDIRVQLVTSNGSAAPLFTLYDVPQSKGCVRRIPTPVPLDRAALPLNAVQNNRFEVDDESFPIARGEYRMRLVVTYHVNDFRQIVRSYDSEQFTISK